jgi:hypothetical protein
MASDRRPIRPAQSKGATDSSPSLAQRKGVTRICEGGRGEAAVAGEAGKQRIVAQVSRRVRQ